MNVCALMSLTEAVAGFNGGSIVDEFPQMTLEECAGRLPVVIMESSIELCDMVQTHNDALVEAAVGQIQTGGDAGYTSLVEGAFDTIKSKITAIFEKIKKFVKSIIDKLGVQINKVRMTGKQMWARYKDSEMLNHSFENLVVNGYKFDKKDPFTSLDSYIGAPRELIKKAVPQLPDPDSFISRVKDAEGKLVRDKDGAADYSQLTNIESDLEKIKEISSEDRKLAFAKEALNGIDVTDGSGWLNELKTELYGDKVDLTYGTDFNLESIKKDLQGEDLDKIRAGYNKLLNALNSDEKTMQGYADKFKSGNKATQGNDVPKVISQANEYFTQFLAIYQDCTGVISSISSTRIGYVNAKVGQAKSIFAKMLTYKKKKEESTDLEGLDEFDVFM